MENTAVITATKLNKRYGALEVVRGIDFTVPAGQCFGLLGPNGAGKSTTMRMIMGLSQITAGELTVFGEPANNMPRNIKAKIGLVPQDNNLDPDISVLENLKAFGRYFALPSTVIDARAKELLEFMQLTERKFAPVNALSGGMQRRLTIARALIGDPEMVILDEPTTGLDPQARVLIWKQLTELKKDGRTLLLTTHYMDEAQRLCDQIVIIDNGEILDQGTPKELISRHVKGFVFEVQKPGLAASAAERWDQEDIGDSVLYFVNDTAEFIADLPEESIYLHRPANLEDVFLRLTGRKLREN
ncbi:ATP-binding cassette domain-containing protein [Sneathiella chungangensis]|uniref:ATP-binding cassette domain-containing protein n=1 Tax=Sneathiella chungangensis TaxID=1418234 RepID=A0A845MMR8_9PROT|nr:ATP-binding cassette domain-containing protein [Sneathiella chungangensis]MZR23824.1 ATP-binding cassette domain-containing protein [Sneathiella chungangensis]